LIIFFLGGGKLKKILLMALIFAVAQSVKAECSITSSDNGIVHKLLQQRGWNFPKFNSVCEKLRRANANIVIDGDASVLVGVSYGWANLSVIDKKTGLGLGDHTSAYTEVNTYASQDKAEELLYEAINNAANDWDGLDIALAELSEKRRKMGISY
jgi:hypothetical protein